MSRPAKANVPTGKLDRAAKEEIVRAGKEISVAQLARKFGVSKTMIFKVRSEYRQRIRPVEQQIGGETVLIAPNAMFGAEMLKARQDEPKKNI
jgi:transposase-like protein